MLMGRLFSNVWEQSAQRYSYIGIKLYLKHYSDRRKPAANARSYFTRFGAFGQNSTSMAGATYAVDKVDN
jgi:hypothetical protein